MSAAKMSATTQNGIDRRRRNTKRKRITGKQYIVSQPEPIPLCQAHPLFSSG
jgi:hypothetical protein